MKERIIAERMAAEVRQVERIGAASATQLAGRLRAMAIRNYDKRTAGQPGQYRKLIFDELKFKMRDALLTGHLLGLHRGISMRPGQEPKLQLGVYDAVIKHLNKLLKLDIDALQEQYSTQALRVVNGVAENVETRLRSSVSGLIEQGATVAEAKRVLGVEFEKAGVSPKGEHQLETIFRTQVQLSYSAGRWEADHEEGIEEILWGYKYVTVGDERVREEHEALEGTTLPKDDSFWDKFFPPNGWNCRCQAISIFDDRPKIRPMLELEDGTRIEPDKGFAFNPGNVFHAGLESQDDEG